ncbi:Uncharacterized protein FWK35_00003657 [Aphis craccivora]|uniref:Uncharacterized protein n=1 Tax=Aphis craccivora TaxID=307492 RepID=A0A6G0YZL9_APHCR|nr:Uncharacterized protein FWK35_00003657 [Aphis craccivora]
MRISSCFEVTLLKLISQGQDSILGFETSFFLNFQYKTVLGVFSGQDLRVETHASEICLSRTLPTTAQKTVDFINSMDKLFNLFNSRSSVSEQPELRRFKQTN